MSRLTEPEPTVWAGWLWFMDDLGGGLALDASFAGGGLAVELQAHFDVVHLLRENGIREPEGFEATQPDESPNPTEALERVGPSDIESGGYDCIALHDALSRPSEGTDGAIRELARFRRALRPRGYLVAASPNPMYIRRSRNSRGISPAEFSRRLAGAGFSEVRRIYVDGTLSRPLALIPDSTSAAIAYEATPAMRGHTRWVRRLLARARLRQFMYPSYYVVARK